MPFVFLYSCLGEFETGLFCIQTSVEPTVIFVGVSSSVTVKSCKRELLVIVIFFFLGSSSAFTSSELSL